MILWTRFLHKIKYFIFSAEICHEKHSNAPEYTAATHDITTNTITQDAHVILTTGNNQLASEFVAITVPTKESTVEKEQLQPESLTAEAIVEDEQLESESVSTESIVETETISNQEQDTEAAGYSFTTPKKPQLKGVSAYNSQQRAKQKQTKSSQWHGGLFDVTTSSDDQEHELDKQSCSKFEESISTTVVKQTQPRRKFLNKETISKKSTKRKNSDKINWTPSKVLKEGK